MPPMSDATAIRDARTQRKTQTIWGANPKPPISPMAELPKPQGVYGECPMPPCQSLPLFGVPNPTRDASYLGSQPQAPSISDGVYLGVAQAPNISDGMYLGECPSPQYLRWRVFGSCPSPQYLRWYVFGRMPKPQGVYGECPMPPMSDAAAIRGAEPIQRRKLFGEPTQAPNISDGMYWGDAQAPGCIWGAPHAPNVRRCRYSGEYPNPYNSIFHFHSSLYS